MRCTEAFEVDHEEVWGTGDGKTFRGFAVGTAARTVPEFVAGEDFLSCVGPQTVVQGYRPTSVGGDLDAYAEECFVCCAPVATCGTLETADVLTGEQICQLAAVAMQVAGKFALGSEEVGRAFAGRLLLGCERSKGVARPVYVQIFMKRI